MNVDIEWLLLFWAGWFAGKTLLNILAQSKEVASDSDTEEEEVPSIWDTPCPRCRGIGEPGKTWGARFLNPDAWEGLTTSKKASSGSWIIPPHVAEWRRRRGKYKPCRCGRRVRGRTNYARGHRFETHVAPVGGEEE